MDQLQKLFNYNNQNVRVVVRDGDPWFVLSDVCKVLELSNSRMVKERLDKDVSSTYPLETSGGTQRVTFINEDGLYDVVLESRKPEAKAFRKWITSEVLPSIRKTGQYVLKQDSFMIDDPIARAERWIEEQKEKQALEVKNKMLLQQVAEYEPKITYLDTILDSKDTVLVSQIAKDYGISARKLNDILYNSGVQYKLNGQWLLYSKHHGQGYTKSITHKIMHNDGHESVKMHTHWTQKGRLFIHEILKEQGIVPLMDRRENPKLELVN